MGGETMTIDEFVKNIEQTFNVKVTKGEFFTESGWNPLEVLLNSQQLQNFIMKFGKNGEFTGAKYNVKQNGVVTFQATKGQSIVSILQRI